MAHACRSTQLLRLGTTLEWQLAVIDNSACEVLTILVLQVKLSIVLKQVLNVDSRCRLEVVHNDTDVCLVRLGDDAEVAL